MVNTVNLSANMNLPVPIVGTDPGPKYALDIDSCLALLDQHDHSAGRGVLITPPGININSDLTFNVINNAISLRSIRFAPQNAPIGNANDLGCAYDVNGDLYYNDGNGNQIRITENGAVGGSPGSISNLVSPASAAYNSTTDTFIWQQGANTPANMDSGSVTIRNDTANANGVTLQAPNSLSADYGITLPLLPAAQAFVTLDQAGNMSAPVPIAQGITLSMLAAAVANALVPVATILPFAGTDLVIPTGYLGCYGQAVSRTAYSNLFGVIGTGYGSGDGSTTFNVPDSRGVFFRTGVPTPYFSTVASVSGNTINLVDFLGFNHSGIEVMFTAGTPPAPLALNTSYYVIYSGSNANIQLAASHADSIAGTAVTLSNTATGATLQWNMDPDIASREPSAVGAGSGMNIGSFEADAYRSHTHPLNDSATAYGGSGVTSIINSVINPGTDVAGGGGPRPLGNSGGSETRPKNLLINYIIKY